MSSAPMKCIIKLGHQPHKVDRKKYGRPYFALYYAERSVFSYPGIYVWVIKKQLRVLPLPKRKPTK